MATNHTSEIESLKSQLQALTTKVQGNEDARKQLLGITMGATAQLESPLETCWRLIMSPHAPSALMTLLNLGAIDLLAHTPGPLSAQQIGSSTNSDPLLIVRLLRPLTALGIVHEKDESLYSATPTTRLLTDPVLKGGYTFMFTTATHTLSQLPTYLAQTNYRNVSGAPGPFQSTKQTPSDLFPWLMTRPDLMSHFNKFMAGQQAQRGDWFDRLPVHDLLLRGARADPAAPLLVDVGGGEGHDIQAFARAFPHALGTLVLQDLPLVVESIRELDGGIVRMGYDFFTEQPVKGARAYYLRSILHDWSNAKCLEILARIREAMTPGYSKLLLNEFILPAQNVPLYPALLDINMMALLNGMERTEKQWAELLGEAGFRVVRFHVDPSGETEGVVEAEVK